MHYSHYILLLINLKHIDAITETDYQLLKLYVNNQNEDDKEHEDKIGENEDSEKASDQEDDDINEEIAIDKFNLEEEELLQSHTTLEIGAEAVKLLYDLRKSIIL